MNASPMTLEGFEAWLVDTQTCALKSMDATTGEAYSVHLGEFVRMCAAISVLLQFQAAMGEAQHARKKGVSA